MLSLYAAESFRFRLLPWFDGWVRRQLTPGDHIISSYGYANASFRWAREHGGRTLVDAGNSHPENFWNILVEEHRRWKCSEPPVARHWLERGMAMMPDVDYVLSPSSWVTHSFLSRGFKPEQIIRNIYPVDLSCFSPATVPREQGPASDGYLDRRALAAKGTPYLLEAFRLVLQRHPSARLRLTRNIQDSALPIVAKYQDLPIDWSPGLPHAQLAERLRSSDIFVLPSLEEGLVRTALEAMACGLPVILTPNTGANDFVQPGVNGEVVPIRDPQAIADAILKWADRVMTATAPPARMFDPTPLSFDYFEKEFLAQLAARSLIPKS